MNTVQELYQYVPLRMLQHPREIVPFGEWMREQGIRSVLEIGTGPGGSTIFFGLVTRGHVTSVDLTGEVHPKLRCLMGSSSFKGVVGNSQEDATERAVSAGLQFMGPPDLVFIDADHTRQAVTENYDRYGKFATKWVAFHDVNASPEWPGMGVPEFWRDLKMNYSPLSDRVKEWINPGSYNGPVWGGIGAVRAR